MNRTRICLTLILAALPVVTPKVRPDAGLAVPWPVLSPDPRWPREPAVSRGRPLPRASRSARPVPVPGWPWLALAACESTGDTDGRPPHRVNWRAVSRTGKFRGGLQFARGSWQAVGGTGDPTDASPAEQVRRAVLLQQRSGWGAWPGCARALGLLR